MNANTEPVTDEIAVYVEKARSAQKKIADFSQNQIDELVTAVCWAYRAPGPSGTTGEIGGR